MYSDKDTCCFCIPLHIAVIIIGCTVVVELIEAFALRRIIMVLFIVLVGILFIVVAIFRNNLIARRVLAYGYGIVFGAEFILIMLFLGSLFMVDPDTGHNAFHAWCKESSSQEMLREGM